MFSCEGKMRKKLIITLCLSLFIFACFTLLLPDYDSAEFKVLGEAVVMNGVIDSDTEETLTILLDENPQVTTIVMENVEGSVDDEANLILARYIRGKGLNTHVPNNGLIASGGTDLFISGVKRTVGSNAKIGVHSWADGSGLEGVGLPRNHPEHRKYLEYYRAMGVPVAFYWFTLEAASSDDIHWMSIEEQKLYKLPTQ